MKTRYTILQGESIEKYLYLNCLYLTRIISSMPDDTKGFKFNDCTVHILKIDSQYINDLRSESKRAEIRFNDRDYQVGDIICFRYEGYSFYQITHVLNDKKYLRRGYVMLSIKKLN